MLSEKPKGIPNIGKGGKKKIGVLLISSFSMWQKNMHDK